MKNRFITLCLASLIGLLPALAQQIPHWQKQGSATQLMVDNRPYLILGGELGNSSASSPQDIDRIFPKLKRTGLNTVLVPAYWDLIEAEEGTFDFSATRTIRSFVSTQNGHEITQNIWNSNHGSSPIKLWCH